VANVLRELSLQTPPDLATFAGTLPGAVAQGRQLARLNIEQRRDLLALFVKSARNVLDDWFESDPIKAAYGFDAIVGHYASPDSPGTAYVLLHHSFGGVNGKKGIWGHAGQGGQRPRQRRRAGRRAPDRRRRGGLQPASAPPVRETDSAR
jgi:phytoene dehydrogenase-like protein